MIDRYDIIVVGAGIVGLSAALALALQGLSIALVERSQPKQHLPTTSCAHDTKVVAVTRASEYFFTHLGVWESIQGSRLSPYQHMSVWDSVMDGRISFSAGDFFEDNLGYIIEQQVILGALWQKIQKQKNVTLFLEEEITQYAYQEMAQLTLKSGRRLHSQLVIAADGAKSLMRSLCHIDSTFIDYHQAAIVATVQGTIPHSRTAYQRFAQDGPLALLPLSQHNQSSIVWTTSAEEAKRLCDASSNTFAVQLALACDGVMGEMELLSKRFVFPLTSHHAKNYVVEGCALIGDAAHTVHPLAGLGVNLGLLDVAAIVEVLAKAKNKKGLGKLTLLKRYERQRKMHNQLMIWSMSAFKSGFGSENPLIQRLRNIGLSWVDKRLTIKQLFAKMALGTLGPVPSLAKMPVQRNNHAKNDSFI